MIKKTLRALRQLNATKEMMQKAEADKPTASNKWWKTDIKYPYKYGVYLRAQHLKGFLKVAVFATEWMRQGICTPCYEIFIDYETELTKALGIDRMRLSRLVAHDGGSLYLSYLQREKIDNTIYPDDILLDLTEKHIALPNLKIMLEHMTLVKAYNYLVRQSDPSDKNPMSQALTTYNDYMNMAVRLQMDTSAEQIYKPKNLKKNHAKVIDLLSQESWDKTAQEIMKKFPKVDKELPRFLKYEYKGSAYQIVAPRTVTDIVREGSLLRHCIHTCDFYFSRYETRETFILFLRKNDNPSKPWYTLEVEPSGNIRQKRTVGDNQNNDLKAAVTFLHEWQQWLQKILSDEDKKLAKISEKKRKENYKKIRAAEKRVWHGKLQGQLLADVLEADFLGLEEIC